MRKLHSMVATFAASTMVAMLVGVSPVSAGTSGGATIEAVGGFVAPGACQLGPPAYRLTVDEWEVEDYYDWSADITVTGPGGYYETDFLWDDEGWNKAWFCASPNRAGTYLVTAEVAIEHLSDDGGFDTSYETVSTTFHVRGRAASAVTYVKREYRAHGWKFRVRVTRAGEAWPHKNVTMQTKICGSWRKVLTKTTGSAGRVAFYSTPRKRASSHSACGVRYTRLPFRFFVPGNYKTKASHSSTFRITRR